MHQDNIVFSNEYSGRFFLTVLVILLFTVVLHPANASNAPAHASRTVLDEPITVAVIPLEFRGDRRWSRVDVGDQVSALITNRLVEMGGNIRVVEREHLRNVLREQDLGAGGRVDPSSAPALGRMLGAQILVFGTVTRFELTSTGGVRVRGIGVGGTRGRVDLTGRIVDSSTGLILGSIEGSGSATGASIDVADIQGVSFDAAEFMESAIGRATNSAVNELTGNLKSSVEQNAARISPAEERRVITGTIVALIENGAVINIGEDDGVRRDQRFEVSRLMRVEGLAEPVRIPAGEIRIVSVEKSAAVGMFISGGDDVVVGDVVTAE